MKPPPMPSGDLRRIVIDALAGSAVQVWKRHTYDSGPYEVTMLRDSTERIARAVEAATLARAVPAGWNLVLRDLVALEADGKHADESAVEVWERARAVLAGRDGGAAMKPPPMPTPARYAGAIEPAFYTAEQIAARDAQWSALLADAVTEARRDALATRDATWEQIVAAAVAQERELCALVCDDELKFRLDAAASHPEDSPSRSRCFAAARAARNCATAIRAQTPPTDAAPTVDALELAVDAQLTIDINSESVRCRAPGREWIAEPFISYKRECNVETVRRVIARAAAPTREGA